MKATLIAKWYYGVDFSEIFSPVAKLSSIQILIAFVATFNWPLFQLVVKNTFLHCELSNKVYMEQPPRLVAQGGSTL